MDFKINAGNKIGTGFSGPSRSYYEAQERFKEILETKLNVTMPDTYRVFDSCIVKKSLKPLERLYFFVKFHISILSTFEPCVII